MDPRYDVTPPIYDVIQRRVGLNSKALTLTGVYEKIIVTQKIHFLVFRFVHMMR